MLMHHPNISAVSWQGENYAADERGVFDVPSEAAADLAAHGLSAWTEPAPSNPKPPSNWSNKELEAKAAELELDITGMERPAIVQAVTAALKA